MVVEIAGQELEANMIRQVKVRKITWLLTIFSETRFHKLIKIPNIKTQAEILVWIASVISRRS